MLGKQQESCFFKILSFEVFFYLLSFGDSFGRRGRSVGGDLVLDNEIYEWVLFEWVCISGLLWENGVSLLMTQHKVSQYQ